MYLVHHAMKVHALLCLDRKGFEEQVHEKGLSATDAAPQVHAAHGRSFLMPSTPEKCAPAAAPRSAFGEAHLQILQLCNDFYLRRIHNVALTA